MPEFFKNITDSMKFIFMLLIYTGYMTWWASGISHDLSSVETAVRAHVVMADHPLVQTQAIVGLVNAQQNTAEALTDITEAHIRCSILMEAMLNRIDRLENHDLHKGEH